MTAGPSPGHGARILIVDDERRNRDLLQVMLAPEGFHLETSATGPEALAAAEQAPPDLIVLDVMMPGMDGYQVARRIRSSPRTRNVPIIMTSALDDRDTRMLALKAGAEDFLVKPVDHAELCVRVRNLLRLKAYGDHYGKYSAVLEGEVAARTADLVERTRTLEQHAVALQRSEERTTYALAAADMGVWELDVPTRRLTWSESMAPLFGLAAAAAPATIDAFYALVHRDDRRVVRDAVERAARDGADFAVEFRALLPDGTTCWHCSEARPVRDGLGTPVRVLGVSRDISDRKSLEAQLRQSQKMEAVGQLAGGVAHDFNNLLTAILGYSKFVIDSFGPHDLRRADLEEVVKAGERAAALTRQLLAFSRQQVLQPSAVDVNALVTGMHAMLSRLIGAQVELVLVLAPNLHKARADAGQLEQILMNLVVNARDAMPAGGRVSVETANVDLDGSSLHEAVIHPGPYVMLAVTDVGTGMSEATKLRLFEPFFTTKQQGKGTGLGLATTYGIVKQSNGYIRVHSEPGLGSTFRVYLPRAGGEPELASVAAETTPASGTEHVLVVEDDQAVRAVVRTMLEHAGYRVQTAGGADEAERLVAAGATSFSLLITDVILPGSSGPALFARLARQRPGLKVLFVSGYTDEAVLRHGHPVGAAEFLPKPFTATVLRHRVRALLDRADSPEQPAGVAAVHP